MAANVPEGMEASSAVACMSVMGFDPALYYAGRGPIEAMAMGIELEPGPGGDALQPGDRRRRASWPATRRATSRRRSRPSWSRRCRRDWATIGCTFYPGGELPAHPARCVTGRRCSPPRSRLRTTSPTDRSTGSLPVGPGAALALDLMERSKAILAGHPVNERRLARGKPPATQIWLFWPGVRPARDARLRRALRRREGRAHLGGRSAPGPGRADRGGLPADPGRHRRPRQRLRGPDGARPWPRWPITTWCSCTWSRRTRRVTRETPPPR